MAAAETLTWDIEAADGGPRRPSLEDVGGATLEDDADDPPDPQTMPYAAQLNQLQKQAAAVGKVVPFVAYSVHFASGTPSVVASTMPRSSVPVFTPSHPGAGDTTITWPAGTFPPATLQPIAVLNQDVGELVGITAVQVTNGVRVRTYRATGGAADLDYTVLYV